jgi:DNA-binding transcriptional LysR family regulator
MNLRFVEAFIVVTRLKSFRAAADKLHTTQPAISSRIAALEEELGVKLFERNSRAVTLTPQGSALLPLAESMLVLQQQMAITAGAPRSLSGTLRIGVMETVVHTWLPRLLSRFSELHPAVSIELSSDITPTLREQLLKRRLDCAFLSEEIPEGYIENRKLMTMAVGWAAAPGLAVPSTATTFAEVAQYPFICFYQESPVYRSIIRLAAGRSLPRISYFSSLTAMVSLAKIGYGIAPLPLPVIEGELARGELRVLNLQPPPMPLPIVGSMRADAPSAAADAMIHLALEVCREYVAERGSSSSSSVHTSAEAEE